MTDDDLLPHAYRTVSNWTFTRWPDAGGTVPTGGPTQGFHCPGRKGPYLFACKNRLHADRFASFSTTLVGAAITTNPIRTLVLFVGPGPYQLSDAWAFNPVRVANQATERERNVVDSKRERNVPILDVEAETHGIPLGEYVAGRASLPGPVEGETGFVSLRRFGVVSP